MHYQWSLLRHDTFAEATPNQPQVPLHESVTHLEERRVSSRSEDVVLDQPSEKHCVDWRVGVIGWGLIMLR